MQSPSTEIFFLGMGNPKIDFLSSLFFCCLGLMKWLPYFASPAKAAQLGTQKSGPVSVLHGKKYGFSSIIYYIRSFDKYTAMLSPKTSKKSTSTSLDIPQGFPCPKDYVILKL